jgi:molybdopterin/thiamine biosynthesis adenylyltransferase/Zn-dependent protease
MNYPYRNPLVQVDIAQPEPDSRLLLNHETGRYLRLGLREFDWLNRLDGQLHVRDLEAEFGQDEALIQELLRRFAAAKLVCFSEEPVALQAVGEETEFKLETRRVEWAQFGQLRIHLGQPTSLLRRLSPITRLLMSKAGVAAGLLAAVIAVVLATAQSAELLDVIQNFQWGAWQTVGLLALLFATTVVHELGHAVACDYFGAPVRSLGVMIYYLQPAAYADVTDSWQLKNRWHRVAISLAGVYVQAIMATLAIALWTGLRLAGQRADMLVMFIALNAVLIIFNVIPFVRLDGYWIFSNMLGVSNLRGRAMEWVRASLISTVTRRPVDAQRLRYNAVLAMPPVDRALLACFGFASVLFGMGMWVGGLGFLFRVTRWVGLAGANRFLAVGGVLVLFVASYLVTLLVARRRARRRPPVEAESQRRTPPVSAIVTHTIDQHRPIQLNPHLSVRDDGNGAVTFAWSTPDALTVQVPATFFETLPRLRDGATTLEDLQQSDLWSPQLEGALQRLWHDRHLRYSSDWDLSEDDDRYSRQLGWFSMNSAARGKETQVQARLRNASVTVLGVGGLGTHVAWNLAACGIGELHLVDGDSVELSNLNRQLFYTPDDVGLRKVDVAAERLLRFNPQLRIRKTHKYLESVDDIIDAIQDSTFVVRAIDSPMESLAWVNEACVRMGVPYSGAGFFPQGTIVGPTVIPGESPCLACNAPDVQPRFDRGTGGTLAPLVAATAGLLACEVITFIGKLGQVQTIGNMLAINAPALNFSLRGVPLNQSCPVCGQQERERVSA